MGEKKKKASIGYYVFVFLVLSGFITPFLYRVHSFNEALDKYNYRDISEGITLSENFNAYVILNQNLDLRIKRTSYYSYWRTFERKDYIAWHNMPKQLQALDDDGADIIVIVDNDSIAKEIINSNKKSEIVDTFQLYMDIENKGDLSFATLESKVDIISIPGDVIDDSTLRAFKLSELSERVLSMNPPGTKEYSELYNEKAPAIIYSSQDQFNDIILFCEFSIAAVNPLKLKCIRYISDQHPDTLVEKVWSNWFSGTRLITWIATFILFVPGVVFMVLMLASLFIEDLDPLKKYR